MKRRRTYLCQGCGKAVNYPFRGSPDICLACSGLRVSELFETYHKSWVTTISRSGRAWIDEPTDMEWEEPVFCEDDEDATLDAS